MVWRVQPSLSVADLMMLLSRAQLAPPHEMNMIFLPVGTGLDTGVVMLIWVGRVSASVTCACACASPASADPPSAEAEAAGADEAAGAAAVEPPQAARTSAVVVNTASIA